QAEQAMANIDLLLREAGSGLADIVKVTVYLTDIRYREPVYRVMGRWLKGVYPVSTGLVVQALARPEWLGEIDATAGISGPDSWRSPWPRGIRLPGRSAWWSARRARPWPPGACTCGRAWAPRPRRTSPTRPSGRA